ncbi:hypothetical protein WJX84_006776 [Apatococcus fuscideae]|uniref:Guanylate cyclase domain-containing protein n=1 Tax=Apatococcus fuscideae TaxID=2026836 RepID=A0AAW1T1H3_9CHLO
MKAHILWCAALQAWISVGAVAQLCLQSCQLLERESLQVLYASTGGPSWIARQGWSATGSSTNDQHCSWSGVTCCSSEQIAATGQGNLSCSASGGVVALLLPRNGLLGSLPDAAFQGLSNLQYVDLSGNSLDGTLPPALAAAPNLILLHLGANNLAGTLPPSLFSSSITSIQLDNNQLTGSLPSMADATALAYLSLSHNIMSGTIPRDLFGCPLLSEFNMDYNQLTGTIPTGNQTSSDWLGNIIESGTFALRLRGNQLTGSLPLSLSYLALEVLDLGVNNLTGEVDVLLANMPYLMSFIVDDNQLQGTLPEEFLTVTLRIFQIQGNNFSGTLPASLGSQRSLTAVQLDENPISGPIPESFIGLEHLTIFTALRGTLQSDYQDTAQQPGALLPSFLAFDLEDYSDLSHDFAAKKELGGAYLTCPALVQNNNQLAYLDTVLIDPYYYRYAYCKCSSGYHLFLQADNSPPQCVLIQGRLSTGAIAGICLGGIFALAVTILGTLYLLGAFWVSLKALARRRAKMQGPPGNGQPLTLLSTDVERSTELWEWNPTAMDAAIRLHDQIIRKALLACYGHELTTEGDAFLIAFWEPADAVKFCIIVQQALLAAAWPEQLLTHVHAASRTTSALLQDAMQASRQSKSDAAGRGDVCLEDPAALQKQVHKADTVFRGLRVRMSIASGTADQSKKAVFCWIQAVFETFPEVAVTQARAGFNKGSRATHTALQNNF